MLLFKSGEVLVNLERDDGVTVTEVVQKVKWRYKVMRGETLLLMGHDLYLPKWWELDRVANELLVWLSDAPNNMREELGWNFSADEIREWGNYNHRYGEYRSVERVYTVSETFEVITPESAANGEAENRGYVFKDEHMNREELIGHIRNGGFTRPSASDIFFLEGWEEEIKGHPWFSTPDPVSHDDRTGADTFKSLFVSAITGNEYWEVLKEAGVVS